MAGTDPRDPLSWPAADPSTPDLEPVDLSSLRVAISEDFGFAPVDDGIRQTFRAAVARFRGVFARADEEDPPLDDSANEVFEVNRGSVFLPPTPRPVATGPRSSGPTSARTSSRALR
jgi:hypothetical protein